MSYHLMHAHAPPPGFHLRVTLSPHNNDPRKWLRAKRGYNTFGRSGHRAPQISFKFFACLRGQSAVISSDQSNSLASMP
jgi:hypothetical protein